MIQLPKVASFARPGDTTAYTAGDAVSTVAVTGPPAIAAGAPIQFLGPFPGSKIDITRVLIQKSTNVVTTSTMELHLFAANPGNQVDNAALTALAFSPADPYQYLGSTGTLAIFAAKAGYAGAVSDNILTTPISIVHGSALQGPIYGVLTAIGAYPPGASEVFQVTLFGRPAEGNLVAKSVTFNRPGDTTAYASGDFISNSTTVGAAMRFPALRGVLNRVIVTKTSNTVANTAHLLYLFSNDPGVVNDNAAGALAVSPSLLGIVTLNAAVIPTSAPLLYAVSDTPLAAANQVILDVPNTPQSAGLVSSQQNSIFGVLVATAAYAPAALEQFSVQLHVAPDAA